LFGPVLRCGPTGAPTDAQEARLCPLAERDAADLLDRLEVRTRSPTAPLASLERLLEGIAAAAAAHTEIASIDLGPVFVDGERAVASTARIRPRRPPERRPWPRTWA